MDDTKDGLLLIATSMIVLVAFAFTVLAVMIIYRKRKLQHQNEIDLINEKFKQELLQAQLEAQQQTMQHIAQEIHDNVGQKLTLAVLYTQQLSPWDDWSQRKIESIATAINDSLVDLRSLSKSLMNLDDLRDNSVMEVIQKECVKAEATGKCAVSFFYQGDDLRISQPAKSVILRIMQEFLQNSLKHAECNLIVVTLDTTSIHTLVLTVEDNGKGFISEDSNNQGMGLISMNKRAEILKARFEIKSLPGKGTKMTLIVPIQ